MKIIVNAISANTGGIVTYTTNLIEYLGHTNLDAIVYVPRSFDPDRLNHPSITVKTVPVKHFLAQFIAFFGSKSYGEELLKRAVQIFFILLQIMASYSLLSNKCCLSKVRFISIPYIGRKCYPNLVLLRKSPPICEET